MALVTSDFLRATLTGYRSTFNENFDAAFNTAPWRNISMEVPSTGVDETHSWLGTVPVMVDVTEGDIEIEGLTPQNYTIANRLWKSAVEVGRTTFEDDKLGLFRPKIGQLGQEAARHPGQLILLLFTVNPLAFDGVAFFSATRVIGESANIANTIAGSGATTVAFLQADLNTAQAAMMRFQDDQGRAMGNRGSIIVCAPELAQLWYQALNANQGTINQPVAPADLITAGSSGYTLMPNQFLTDTNDWYLLHLDGVIKPFIFQNRLTPSLEGITTPDSESGVVRDKFVYSVRARYNVGVGDPRHAIRVTNA